MLYVLLPVRASDSNTSIELKNKIINTKIDNLKYLIHSVYNDKSVRMVILLQNFSDDPKVQEYLRTSLLDSSGFESTAFNPPIISFNTSIHPRALNGECRGFLYSTLLKILDIDELKEWGSHYVLHIDLDFEYTRNSLSDYLRGVDCLDFCPDINVIKFNTFYEHDRGEYKDPPIDERLWTSAGIMHRITPHLFSSDRVNFMDMMLDDFEIITNQLVNPRDGTLGHLMVLSSSTIHHKPEDFDTKKYHYFNTNPKDCEILNYHISKWGCKDLWNSSHFPEEDPSLYYKIFFMNYLWRIYYKFDSLHLKFRNQKLSKYLLSI